jgi:hypothetical protein
MFVIWPNAVCVYVTLNELDIQLGKFEDAWDLYLKIENSGEALTLLQLIAHESYKVLLPFIHHFRNLDFSFPPKLLIYWKRLIPVQKYGKEKEVLALACFNNIYKEKKLENIWRQCLPCYNLRPIHK